jgi:prepilin-type N-terminal cleavage/methylation domain-containing protein/prepilin-type processing-associated H-X9-DG protein
MPRNHPGLTLVEVLVVLAIIGLVTALLLPAVQQAREAARRAACQNHLRQLGLALHHFHDCRRAFPPSGWTVASPGNPTGKYIGWRTLILPHLEQASLEDLYDPGEHWWEGRNLAAASHRVAVLECPSVPQRKEVLAAVAKPPRPAIRFPLPLAPSDYEALMGVQPVVNPALYATAATNRSVLHRNSATRLEDVKDGTSQTIVVVECAARPLVYRGRFVRPELSNDQGQGWIDSESAFSLDGASADGARQGLGPALTPHGLNATNENEPYSLHPRGGLFLFADGHVAFLSEATPLAVLAALATRDGGEVIAPHGPY